MRVKAVTTPTLAVSLGNVASLIQHPASMIHSTTPKKEKREKERKRESRNYRQYRQTFGGYREH